MKPSLALQPSAQGDLPIAQAQLGEPPLEPKAETPEVQEASPALDSTTPAFYRNKRVNGDLLEGDELKAYARYVGVAQRDVDNLTTDRLRQNIKARIHDAMED